MHYDDITYAVCNDFLFGLIYKTWLVTFHGMMVNTFSCIKIIFYSFLLHRSLFLWVQINYLYCVNSLELFQYNDYVWFLEISKETKHELYPETAFGTEYNLKILSL